jgi:asparagine synthase (glutamine-hydrolysing)
MIRAALLPGFVAATGELRRRAASAVPGAGSTRVGPATIADWGAPVLARNDESLALAVSRVMRRTSGAIPAGEVLAVLREEPERLVDMLPPFGGVLCDAQGVRMVADGMGFQQLYLSASGGSDAVTASSALVAARVTGASLDPAGVGIQSLLGWQMGQRTLFQGISKLAPGATARMSASGIAVQAARSSTEGPLRLDDAVAQAAELLREALGAVLDDHPDAVLQLTGGMDSRLLLSAIPASRRRGLHAMTLDVPGKGDVAIARQLADAYGIVHDVQGLTPVAAVTPAEAWQLVRVEATRLDAMSDPVALAAQRIAERAFPQGVRISGLGGEVARGFYYVGRVADRSYTRADAARLAGWRMFVNEAVEPGLLTDAFTAWARETAIDAVYNALRAGGPEWFRATDELYLRHRMQRWAGATDVAVSAARVVLNPMLDSRFLGIAARLRPQDKVGARFLALLQERLDPDLARVPLDGRPAPVAYAHPSNLRPVTEALGTGRRIARKAVQRLQRGNRPPAGGDVLAAKVVEHWRSAPETLSPLTAHDFVSPAWVDGVRSGAIVPRPSAVSFVTNLLVAVGDEE